jgi:hypothetical protein
MPISNNASYIPTIDEFIGHWTLVNGSLTPALVVRNEAGHSSTLAQFSTLRETIRSQALTVVDLLNDQEIARGAIDLKKAQMLAWLTEFNGLLDAYWAGSRFLKARPVPPSETLGEEKFLNPMRDVASLWAKLNADTAPVGLTLPLTLSDGTLQVEFGNAISDLQDAYTAERMAAQAVVLARAQREENKQSAYLTMKAYRLAVPARAKQFPALVETVPKLTPAGGHTPDPVNASAVFQAPDQAKVVYEASEDAALDHYELRGNPGDAYDDDDAVTIEQRQPGDAREFLTGFGLTQPGAHVALKVYVVLNMGNEAGSAAMVVTRPG